MSWRARAAAGGGRRKEERNEVPICVPARVRCVCDLMAGFGDSILEASSHSGWPAYLYRALSPRWSVSPSKALGGDGDPVRLHTFFLGGDGSMVHEE